MDDIKHIFERQKKELSQSVKYASYIQKALLPSESIINRILTDHFILFLPRDIVSGDFYWISKKSNLIYLAVGDCTGHGVPGAFLSILGISFLNHIIDNNKYTSSSLILNALREHIMKALNQTGEESEQKDGIDMGVCVIDLETNILNFSGAFNPLYVIKNDNKLIEIPGDKMQIGVAADTEQPFKNHVIDLKKGDMLYLFTDGFVDQFGGPEGKKYKYQQFRKLLLSINKMSTLTQKNKLVQELDAWKGNHQQLDDVLILGLRYN